MPKTIEQGSTPFTTWLGNFTALPTEWIFPVIALHYGYGDQEDWKFSNLLNLRINLGKEETKSLFYNGILYIRLMLPLWIGIHFRWRSAPKGERCFIQTGFGWKLNGRLGLLLRIQSDESAANGTAGPNYDQANGWKDGTK